MLFISNLLCPLSLILGWASSSAILLPQHGRSEAEVVTVQVYYESKCPASKGNQSVYPTVIKEKTSNRGGNLCKKTRK